jgi:4-carboxymuconolactone decarboxylase
LEQAFQGFLILADTHGQFLQECQLLSQQESGRPWKLELLHGLVQYTTDVLFRDLWLRPDLSPRDRSLVTVTALIASGQVAHIPYHLNRAMDNGLTREEAGEVITHLAFYVGWPNAFSALPVAKDVLEKRASP